MPNRIGSFVIVMALVCSISIRAVAKTNSQLPSLTSISTALSKYINYEMCSGDGGPHGGTPYFFGKHVTLSLTFSKDEGKFYIWGDDLQYSIELHHPRMADLYYGTYSDHRIAITGVDGANTAVKNIMQWLMRRKQKFFSGQIKKFDYTIPKQCVMSFPPSPEKTAMLNTIVNTMTDFVKQVDQRTQFQYPTPLHIVIANFDVDYPRTFVYIPETREVYNLTLHDITNYFGDTFLKDGYPLSLVNYFSKDSPFVKKILKYGIYKTIDISRPGTSKKTVSAVRLQ